MTDNTDKNSNKSNDLTKLITALGNERKIPPLDKWTPETITPFDIVIDDNGEWYHDGVKIVCPCSSDSSPSSIK